MACQLRKHIDKEVIIKSYLNEIVVHVGISKLSSNIFQISTLMNLIGNLSLKLSDHTYTPRNPQFI